MVMGLILMIIDDDEFPEWLIFIKSLQFILHISLMNIAMPGNVIEISSLLY